MLGHISRIRRKFVISLNLDSYIFGDNILDQFFILYIFFIYFLNYNLLISEVIFRGHIVIQQIYSRVKTFNKKYNTKILS